MQNHPTLSTPLAPPPLCYDPIQQVAAAVQAEDTIMAPSTRKQALMIPISDQTGTARLLAAYTHSWYIHVRTHPLLRLLRCNHSLDDGSSSAGRQLVVLLRSLLADGTMPASSCRSSRRYWPNWRVYKSFQSSVRRIYSTCPTCLASVVINLRVRLCEQYILRHLSYYRDWVIK
jgi:hypothetical protein